MKIAALAATIAAVASLSACGSPTDAATVAATASYCQAIGVTAVDASMDVSSFELALNIAQINGGWPAAQAASREFAAKLAQDAAKIDAAGGPAVDPAVAAAGAQYASGMRAYGSADVSTQSAMSAAVKALSPTGTAVASACSAYGKTHGA